MVIITGLRGCAVAFANGLVIRVKYALVSDHVEGEGGGPILLPRFWLGRITRYRGATVRHARRLLACPVLEFPVTGSRFKSGRCCTGVGTSTIRNQRRGFLRGYGQEGRCHRGRGPRGRAPAQCDVPH